MEDLTFQQFAYKLGVSCEEIKRIIVEEGLMHPDGTLTQKGIDSGYFEIEEKPSKQSRLRPINTERAIFIYNILQAFSAFTQMCAYRNVIGMEQTYKGVESTAALLEFITGESINPSDLFHDDDDLTNKTIQLNEKLETYISSIEEGLPYPKGYVMSVLKHLEYSPKTYWIRSAALVYASLAEELLGWSLLLQDENELQIKIAFLKKSMFGFHINKRAFIKSVHMIENIFLDILKKRRERNKDFIIDFQ